MRTHDATTTHTTTTPPAHPAGSVDLAPVLRGGMRVAVLAGLVLGASGAATHSIIPTVSII